MINQISEKLNSKNKLFLSLFSLFIVSVWLRFAFLDTNLFFGPEQGRDFLVIKDLVLQHKFTLIGSKTDISGIFHGPLFYYLTAIPFLLSYGDPLFSIFFLILINSSTVFFIYMLGKRIHGSATGLIAAVIFTVSFNAIVYGRWLSNPPLSIPLVSLAMLFLLNFLSGNKKNLLGFSICLGLLAQAEFLNILFYAVFTLSVVIVFFDRFRKISLVFLLINFLIALFLSIGSFILFDIRHQFLITKTILNLFNGKVGFHTSLLTVIQKSGSVFFNEFSFTVLPFWEILSLIFLICGIILVILRVKKHKEYVLLLLWLLIPVVLLIMLRHDILGHFFVSLIPAFILITALMIEALIRKSFSFGIIVMILFVGVQIFTWINTIPQNNEIFFQSTQLKLRYSDKLATIDRIYKESGNQSFAFQSYTIPYWSQQGWEYLFWSYGERKYGRLPVNQLDAKKLFVIVQDDSNTIYQQDWLKNTVSKWGSMNGTFRYGILTTRELQL